GHTMLPSVSEPSPAVQRLADTEAADPELEPHGFRSIAYGLLHWPPRPLQPLDEWNERKFAHSLKVVLPRITAPAARSLAATVESFTAGCPVRANEPAVVCIESPVSMLSFNRTGMPWSGPRTFPPLRSASNDFAIACASGLTSMTELSPGPFTSMVSIRVR